MSGQPLVSVIMPVYNAAPFVSQAIESILAQTFDEYEFVIVNDGSTDDSLTILREFERSERKIRVISRPNTGIAGAIADALEATRGEFVAMMHADDVALPKRLDLQVAFLSQNPAVGVVGSAIQIIDRFGAVRLVIRYSCDPPAVRKRLALACELAHPAVLMRRSALVESGGYRAAFVPAEDYDLWLRMNERWEIANLPDVLLHYRWHDSQLSARGFEMQVIATLAAQQSAAARRAGRSDPFEKAMVLSREVVIDSGVPTEKIDQTLIDACLGRSSFLLKIGLREEAEKSEALAFEYAARSGLQRYAASRIQLEVAHRRLLAGQYIDGVTCGVLACVNHPILLGKVLSTAKRAIPTKWFGFSSRGNLKKK